MTQWKYFVGYNLKVGRLYFENYEGMKQSTTDQILWNIEVWCKTNEFFQSVTDLLQIFLTKRVRIKNQHMICILEYERECYK